MRFSAQSLGRTGERAVSGVVKEPALACWRSSGGGFANVWFVIAGIRPEVVFETGPRGDAILLPASPNRVTMANREARHGTGTRCNARARSQVSARPCIQSARN